MSVFLVSACDRRKDFIYEKNKKRNLGLYPA